MSELMLEKLNEAERVCVDHLRQAQVLGVSLAEYCRSFDLDLSKWYRVKQALARKGITVTATSVAAAEVHPGERHFYTMSVDGGPATKFTTMTGESDVTVSPDEKSLAVIRDFKLPPDVAPSLRFQAMRSKRK